MKKNPSSSFSKRLARKFMFLVTGIVFLFSVSFMFLTKSMVNKSQGMELKKAEEAIFNAFKEVVESQGLKKIRGGSLGSIPDVPYYLTYSIYNKESLRLLATNDPFLPVLEETEGRVRHYYQKKYFFDGDLNIIYYADTYSISNINIVVAVALNMDNNNPNKMFDQLPSAILVLAIPVLFLSFIISLFITKNTINPVIKITQQAQTMMDKRKIVFLPVSKKNDEIDELSSTFNRLFTQIKNDFARERQFSSDVSHELNTPLQVILGQTNLLIRWGKNDPEQLEKSLTAIKSETKTMQSIIANLLQISRVESGRVKPEFSEVKLFGLFNWIKEEFSAIAPELKFQLEESDIILKTDSEMLHQILTVLISNSVKYAGSDCSVSLSAKERADSVTVYVSDDGPGFSEESIPHLFERFYRADEAHSRKISGSGLGLSIAQTLCNALNAKIKAYNMESHGAGFEIEFFNHPLLSSSLDYAMEI